MNVHNKIYFANSQKIAEFVLCQKFSPMDLRLMFMSRARE